MLHRQRGVQQRRFEPRSLPGALTVVEAERDPVGEHHGHRAVGRPHARADGRVVGGNAAVHDAGQCLEHEVIAAAVGVGALLAVAGKLDVNQPRIDPRQPLVGDAEAFGGGGAVVMDQHVAFGHQLVHDLQTLRRPDIDADGPLVAVDGEVRGAFVAQGPAGEDPPRPVAVGGFELDHVGALIGKVERRAGGRPHRRQFNNLYAFEDHVRPPDASRIPPPDQAWKPAP